PLLETQCRSRDINIVFLPKFHCELNFIEQDLEINTIRYLDSIELPMMRKFATRSRRFMDAYDRGLNGRQAAWASRKYRGHRVLPDNILDELEREGVV
ncbi:hypothetical protein BDN70DRAFT_879866, partial [Pholiota conissans]